MKAVKLILAIIMLTGTMQAKAAGESIGPSCDLTIGMGLLMGMTITSAPTGTYITTEVLSGKCDLALNLNEDAIQYKITGHKS